MEDHLLKILSLSKIFHSFVLCCISIHLTAQAPTWHPAGQGGGIDVKYMIKGTDTLIFQGEATGEMGDYLLTNGNPAWKTVTTVIINEKVKTIGNGAFIDCVFTSISLPNSLISIGERAFESCVNLRRITIPANVKNFGKEIFDNCNLDGIRIESSTPPTISDLVFDAGAQPFIKLIVPYGAAESYQKPIWNNFSEIVEVIPIKSAKINVGGGGSYDGTPKTPSVTVKYGSTLVPDTDYTFEYRNNINAGKAQVAINGLFFYTDTKNVTFDISQIEDTTMVWPVLTVEEGQILGKAIFKGGTKNGTYTFATPDFKPTLNDSDSKPFELRFTPDNHNYCEVKTHLTVTVVPPSGYKDRLQEEILIYPNPFFDEVHLKGSTGCTLKVLNVAGVSVHSQQITNTDEIIRLDKLPAGMYFFRFEKNGKAKTLKVGKR
ncbi:MAG: leucine-rich repeat domain-containing protein [Bacteroidales bacterium]|jgi:hypothetical protein|nr:leucine-rich repeat domain-containing protein [Bacteroidales bacterium]